MIADIAWKGFKLTFGLVCLANMVAVAAFHGNAFTRKERPETKKTLLASQEKYWSIDREPLTGFKHHFFTTRTGVKLHYVVNDHAVSDARNVALFIHGFPDSFLLWRHILKSASLEQNILIAVDIPGYGGSDDLPVYGANEILEAISEFILEMRNKYTPDGARKFVVVSHDWGAIIAARLASEAKQLADRWVITSGIIPQVAQSNTNARAASAKQMLHTWTRSPFNLRPFKNALFTLGPVFGQFSRSFYIFIFNLPWPLAYFFATMGKFWLLKSMHNVSAGYMGKDGKFTKRLDSQETGDWMAMSAGPGLAQIEESKGAYPEATRRRVKDHGMSQKIRIYRDNLFLAPWEKSLETVVALSEIPQFAARSNSGNSGLFDDGPYGSIKAPATFVMGKNDPGFDKKLGMDGISDYIGTGSQALLINESGHWLPNETLGRKVLETVTEWALKGEEEGQKLAEQLSGIPEVEFIADK